MRRTPFLFSLAALALLGCENEPEETTPDETIQLVDLSAEEHLVRASIALRGVRPSLEELRRVQDDPKAVAQIVDEYLSSPEFGRTLRDLHNEALMLRPDWAYYPAGFPARGKLAQSDMVAINLSVQEAPLKLIEHVVMNDLPYGEIVTADYVMADSLAATVWNLPYQAGGAEWQQTAYKDARGKAGILSDSWLYVRWQSTPSNANRARANAVSRALLCYDVLSRDVELDTSVNHSDPNAVQQAVENAPPCASCHQAVDPMASFFKDIFPIVVPDQLEDYPAERMWLPGVFEIYLGIEMREPAYFGQPGETLTDLGRMISEDPRFSRCAAQRFYAYFNQVPLSEVPFEEAASLQEKFIDSGLNARALTKAVIMGERFRASHTATKHGSKGFVGLRKARPDELASMIEDLTGFVWKVDLGPFTENQMREVELPRDSFIGFRVIGGGTDSAYVTENTFTDNATSSLFLRTFAEEAAAFVVRTDLGNADRASRKLLTLVEEATSDEPTVRAQLAELHGRVLSELVAADSAEVDATFALYQALLAESQSSRRAWEGTLAAMLQDVRITYY